MREGAEPESHRMFLHKPDRSGPLRTATHKKRPTVLDLLDTQLLVLFAEVSLDQQARSDRVQGKEGHHDEGKH